MQNLKNKTMDISLVIVDWLRILMFRDFLYIRLLVNTDMRTDSTHKAGGGNVQGISMVNDTVSQSSQNVKRINFIVHNSQKTKGIPHNAR